MKTILLIALFAVSQFALAGNGLIISRNHSDFIQPQTDMKSLATQAQADLIQDLEDYYFQVKQANFETDLSTEEGSQTRWITPDVEVSIQRPNAVEVIIQVRDMERGQLDAVISDVHSLQNLAPDFTQAILDL